MMIIIIIIDHTSIEDRGDKYTNNFEVRQSQNHKSIFLSQVIVVIVIVGRDHRIIRSISINQSINHLFP